MFQERLDVTALRRLVAARQALGGFLVLVQRHTSLVQRLHHIQKRARFRQNPLTQAVQVGGFRMPEAGGDETGTGFDVDVEQARRQPQAGAAERGATMGLVRLLVL